MHIYCHTKIQAQHFEDSVVHDNLFKVTNEVKFFEKPTHYRR